MIDNLISEALAVADKLGISFDTDMIQWFHSFAGKDPNHKTSTLQDILRNKKTELDFMNGYIVKMGIKYNIKTLANISVVNMMKLIEEKL